MNNFHKIFFLIYTIFSTKKTYRSTLFLFFFFIFEQNSTLNQKFNILFGQDVKRYRSGVRLDNRKIFLHEVLGLNILNAILVV